MEKAVFPRRKHLPKQQIVCSRSFGERVTTYEAMRQAVCQYAERAAEKLRGERQFCRHIAVFVKTSPFAVNEPYYGNLASENYSSPRRTHGTSLPLPSELWTGSGWMVTVTQRQAVC